MRCAWILVLAAGCVAPVYDSPNDYLDLELGRSWVYSIHAEGMRRLELTTKLLGSDLRSLPDEDRVVFMQLYGRIEPDGPDLTKSMYAMSSSGPREFVFNTWAWSMQHEPPIPLVPTKNTTSEPVEWEGVLVYRKKRYETTARVRLAGEEVKQTPLGALRCVKVVTTYAAGDIEITRWFASGVGLVEVRVVAVAGDAGAKLLSTTEPS